MRAFVLCCGIALLGVTAAAQAQSVVAGNWALSFNTPNGTRESSAVFKVDGDTLSGTLTSEMGEMPIKGKTKGNTFAITLDVQTQNGAMSIAISGEVDGDTLKGVLDFGQGTGEFTGKRKAS